MRKIASIGYNLLLRLLFSLDVKDVNSKPKLMTRKIYKGLSLTSKDWFIDSELLLKACSKKLKIVEVPVIYKKREKGKSTVKLGIIKDLFIDAIKFKINRE